LADFPAADDRARPTRRHVRIAYWPAAPAQAPVACVPLRASAPPPQTAQGPIPAPRRRPARRRAAGARLAGDRQRGAARPRPGRRKVRFDARIGRPLAEGLSILAATALPSAQPPARTVLAFSLFTNDAPADVDELDTAVRASVARLGPHDCAIWATISRPAVHGVSVPSRQLAPRTVSARPQLAGRLLVVRSTEEVARHRGWKAHDHVHATTAGYLARARLFADAARSSWPRCKT
jgi:hypothetical protein